MTTPSASATHLLDILQAERERGFDGLAGSTVEATLPLRQAALDALLSQVRDWPAALDTLTVDIGDANRFLVTAVVRVLGFRTPVRLQVQLAPSMTDGLVHLVIDDGSLMASAVALLGPLLGHLPEGIVLQGRRFTVDVQRLAARQGVADLAGMVSSATFASSRGVLWVTVHVAAPALPPLQSPRVPRPSMHPSVPFDVASLRTWLQGSQLEVDLHIDTRLANDLVAALHADAQVPSGDALRDTVLKALRPPVVHFDAGGLRVSATAALDHDDPPAR